MATTPPASPTLASVPWYAKKAYSSTIVTVSGISVTLKQPTFAIGLTDASTKIKQMVQDAHTALLKADGILTAYDLTHGVYTQFEQLFNPEKARDFSHREAWEAIKPKLTKIRTGLTMAHGIKVGTLTSGVGSVKHYTGGRVGDIHLDKSLFNGGFKSNATLTYLHEASHKYAGTHDYGYWDHKASTYTQPKKGGTITNVETLSNADSFAYILFCLAGAKAWSWI